MLTTLDGEVVFRTGYNYDMHAASMETALVCPEPSLAVQDAAQDADINEIVRRFGLTGQLPDQPIRMPMSGDFTEGVTDFQTAMNAVIAAEQAFMELPADVRYRFGNDPQKLLEFVENPDNLEEARKLNLAVPAPAAPVKPEPMEVRVVNEPPPKAEA